MNIFHADCVYCRLCRHDDFPEALCTPLVFEDTRVVVVIDLDRKQYRERYLIVTKYGHYPQEELPQEEWDYMVEVAHALGKARVWKTMEKYVVDIIMSDVSYAHLQVCFGEQQMTELGRNLEREDPGGGQFRLPQRGS